MNRTVKQCKLSWTEACVMNNKCVQKIWVVKWATRQQNMDSKGNKLNLNNYFFKLRKNWIVWEATI